MLFKAGNDGFTLLYETSSNGTKRSRQEILDGETSLRFHVTLTDSNFFNYTETGIETITETVFYFHNIGGDKNERSSTANLHEKDFVSKADVRSCEEIGERFFTKPFAVIDLCLLKDLSSQMYIYFREKQTYWRYILAGDYLQTLQKPAVISDVNTFKGPQKLVLPDKKEALAFVSEAPIGLNQIPGKTFKLVENYEPEMKTYRIVKRMLPTPDISSISLLDKEDKTKQYSEIFIY